MITTADAPSHLTFVQLKTAIVGALFLHVLHGNMLTKHLLKTVRPFHKRLEPLALYQDDDGWYQASVYYVFQMFNPDEQEQDEQDYDTTCAASVHRTLLHQADLTSAITVVWVSDLLSTAVRVYVISRLTTDRTHKRIIQSGFLVLLVFSILQYNRTSLQGLDDAVGPRSKILEYNIGIENRIRKHSITLLQIRICLRVLGAIAEPLNDYSRSWFNAVDATPVQIEPDSDGLVLETQRRAFSFH
jgi:hypothetical protein